MHFASFAHLAGRILGPSDLARRLKTSPQVVNRLMGLQHATNIDKVEQALGCLGRRLEMRVV